MEKLKSISSDRTLLETGVEERPGVMTRLEDRFLRHVQFEAQDSEYHIIRHSKDSGGRYDIFHDDSSAASFPENFVDRRNDHSEVNRGVLRCLFQRSRPSHTSGKTDLLPFANVSALHKVFQSLELPSSYFQIADGSLATALAYIFYDQTGRPCRFELVAHCLTKQGDWAMALSHSLERKSTSVFMSVDERVQADPLMEDLQTFQDYAMHPMLLPCIVFSATFRMAVQRRHDIKAKVSKLEKALGHITAKPVPEINSDYTAAYRDGGSGEIEFLFELLHSCRKDQASQKGRYDFWNSFYRSIEKGFEYSKFIASTNKDEKFFKANSELQHWAALIWQRLQSLNERDKDHVDRVANHSHTLYSLVQQRDMRLQSSIARASQRDSEDMKFIAVLGSVFLPASLVATILNVPAFQFAEGGTLFGLYIAITVPFIIVVVMICFTRPYWSQWRPRTFRATLP